MNPDTKPWTEYLGLFLVQLRHDLRHPDPKVRQEAQSKYKSADKELTTAISYVQHIRRCYRQEITTRHSV